MLYISLLLHYTAYIFKSQEKLSKKNKIFLRLFCRYLSYRFFRLRHIFLLCLSQNIFSDGMNRILSLKFENFAVK